MIEIEKNDIQFYAEDFDFSLSHELQYKDWLIKIATSYKMEIGTLTYVFTSDDYLLEMNRSYLNHDYYTDIISFPLNEDPISGDIFISIERVKENAKELQISFDKELLRVMSHGLLHFIGFDDHNKEDIAKMRKAEEQAIELFN